MSGSSTDLDYLWSLTSGSVVRSDADVFWNAFEHADTFGSLIQPNEALIPVLKPVVEQLETTGNLLATPARRVLDQAEQLSTRYHVVVANPAMGEGNMGAALTAFRRRARIRGLNLTCSRCSLSGRSRSQFVADTQP
jgi:hypothetical protein